MSNIKCVLNQDNVRKYQKYKPLGMLRRQTQPLMS